MAEYIEREAAMDVREKLVDLLHLVHVKVADLVLEDNEKTYSDAIGMEADHLIANGVTVQEWIPVDDRLPESGVHVLICCEMHRYGGEIAGKYVCDGYYAEANKIIAGGFSDECECEYSEEDDEYYLCEGWYEVIKNWDDYNSVAVEDFVTHWMPLPEPPKGE